MRVITQFEKKTLVFTEPEFIISCRDPLLLADCFQQMEQALSKRFYLAGFFSYETGYGFEKKLARDKISDFPLICLGAYSAPKPYLVRPQGAAGMAAVHDLCLNISQEKYFSNIETIRRYIANGDVYQITYCLKLLFGFSGDPFVLYSMLLKSQPVPYPAYIEADGFQILSLSPEMFIKKNGSLVITKPMKGTWPRGSNTLTDMGARWRFQFDEKNRAENVMIADLLRNDLGRIGEGIRAPKLFEVTPYKLLYQMTSTVCGQVKPDIKLYDLFAALFPSGSVTGAPKIRAMQVIQELEPEDRKIYTGAIGYITPQKDMFFNIPIRTLLLNNGQGEMGIGGGIVWDSTPQGEWDEGLLKARFLTDLAMGKIAAENIFR